MFVFIGPEVQQIWNLTEIEYAIYPAVTSVANLLGAIVTSGLTDYCGRVWPYALTFTVVGVFGIADAFSPNYAVLIILRFVASVGIGGISVVSLPTFVEFLPRKNRGSALILTNVFTAIGLIAATGLAWWLIPAHPHSGWRYFTIATLSPSLLVTLFRLVFYFESPRYFISKNKIKEAWKVFEQMAWMNGKDLTEFVHFSSSVGSEKSSRPPIRDLAIIFKRPYLRRTVCLSGLLVTEIMGYLGATLFLPQELEKLNVDKYFSIMVAFVAQIPGVLLMAIIVEWKHIGRLNSLRFFSFIATIFFFLVAFVQSDVTIPVFLVFIYFSLLPLLTVIYAYISESYPTNIRALSLAYFMVLQALVSIAVPFLSAFLVSFHHTWLYCCVWGGTYAVNLLFALLLNYEPRQQRLLDVVT